MAFGVLIGKPIEVDLASLSVLGPARLRVWCVDPSASVVPLMSSRRLVAFVFEFGWKVLLVRSLLLLPPPPASGDDDKSREGGGVLRTR